MFALPKTFFPSHQENRMKSEGDVQLAREIFFKTRPNNLNFLLQQRFLWMNEYLNGLDKVIEIGSGPAFSKEFIQNSNFKTSDVVKREWVDLEVDAFNMPFQKESLDALVCSHMIHHLAYPKIFFKKAHEVLKPGGLIVISEIYTSWLMRVLLWLMRHEGWSYEKNVFDERTVANEPGDPWSANCAIPQLLFSDVNKFEREIPGFKVIHKEMVEGFIFPLSGGVIAKRKVISLPVFVLKIVETVDRILIKFFPNVFSLGMRVVIQKT